MDKWQAKVSGSEEGPARGRRETDRPCGGERLRGPAGTVLSARLDQILSPPPRSPSPPDPPQARSAHTLLCSEDQAAQSPLPRPAALPTPSTPPTSASGAVSFAIAVHRISERRVCVSV
eukprot:2035811-Rhodomonas_salina.5